MGTDSLSSGVTQGPAFQGPTLGLGVGGWGQGRELKEAAQETEHKCNSCGSEEEARLGMGGDPAQPPTWNLTPSGALRTRHLGNI